MPGITLFKRRWNIGSDDFFYPSGIELMFRTLWFLPQLIYVLEYKTSFQCIHSELLSLYYFGYLGILVLIIINQTFIIIISARGTITNEEPRKNMYVLIYLRIFLTFFEVTWSIIGTIWLSETNWASCSKLLLFTVLANIIFCLVALLFLLFVTFIIFDPISHLPEHDIVSKRKILYDCLKKVFFCCYCCLYTGNSRSPHYENSYRQISSFLEMLFRGGDLTPTDVLVGTILLSDKEKNQFTREAKIARKKSSKVSTEQPMIKPSWMNVNEAAHFVRYAVAPYSWPYYIYMHNLRGISHLCCSKSVWCRCKKNEEATILDDSDFDRAPTMTRIVPPLIEGDTRSERHLKAFKFLAKVEDTDLIYANFHNELFLTPFCVLLDHFKKTVVITIRGTLSMRDVITDVTAECGNFDIDHLTNEPCHIGFLNTAENIYEKIKSKKLLEKAFKLNPSYQLLVTGHSLGAGAAVILSLKLKKEYPNIRCIAYSPSGHLISRALVEYTRSFVLSVVLGDDIIARLSLRSVHNLKADILKEIYNCPLPKYKIYWKYSLSFFINNIRINPNNKTSPFETQRASSNRILSASDDDASSIDGVIDELDNSINSTNSQSVLIKHDARKSKRESIDDINIIPKLIDIDEVIENDPEKMISSTVATRAEFFAIQANQADNNIADNTENNIINQKEARMAIKSIKSSLTNYKELKQMMRNVYDTYPELLMPGNILYIYKIQDSNQLLITRICTYIFCCFSRNKSNVIHYDSRWADQDEFKKIVITNRMLMDHFPNNLMDGLNYFSSTDRLVV